ncbi:hypothetical protein CPJCM30710_03990 [Clostridium polyendosporum]|uniref:DUF2382 domain-containing protein n=1 Tax=Clostridium polyendosporum TaxID=69208 RepID=A0A919RY84_9CLOT|nr:YsnF/AvaK domain-containing protein [Clostridium polyendosporum]GIM27733.1 hypothetical protein CPJCM30710_03990 [Clostridium polyendosporum]
MSKKFMFYQERTEMSRGVAIGALAGGIFGAVLGILNEIGTLVIPILGFIITASPVNAIITGTVLGIFIGGGIGSLIVLYNSQAEIAEYDSYVNNHKNPEQVINDINTDAKLQLRKEKLDIVKKWIKTGEVAVHKEAFTVEKNITVPVTREELVIEKKVLNTDSPDQTNNHIETIRIPISEERIEVTKHPVILEDVEIYNHQFQEIEHIKETLKKEKLHVKTTGKSKVINKKT